MKRRINKISFGFILIIIYLIIGCNSSRFKNKFENNDFGIKQYITIDSERIKIRFTNNQNDTFFFIHEDKIFLNNLISKLQTNPGKITAFSLQKYILNENRNYRDSFRIFIIKTLDYYYNRNNKQDFINGLSFYSFIHKNCVNIREPAIYQVDENGDLMPYSSINPKNELEEMISNISQPFFMGASKFDFY